MPRRSRNEAPGAVHHVVAQGNNGCAIVLEDHDRLSLLRRLAAVAKAFDWRCLAYCLLDTHLHVLVETQEPNLGQGMQRLLGGYAHSFNRRHGREGHLFASPFFSRLVEHDEHLITAAVYVVVNPVIAGLAGHPSSWPWGSYRATERAFGELRRDRPPAGDACRSPGCGPLSVPLARRPRGRPRYD